ncbi:hypothetical protein HK097_007600, partial [Rhizophlyctis rosea]
MSAIVKQPDHPSQTPSPAPISYFTVNDTRDHSRTQNLFSPIPPKKSTSEATPHTSTTDQTTTATHNRLADKIRAQIPSSELVTEKVQK